MRPLEKSALRGRTQLCTAIASGQASFSLVFLMQIFADLQHDVARFSAPIELAFVYDTNAAASSVAAAFQWPRLLLRVLGEDAWRRPYVDGYATLVLPTTPTSAEPRVIECWRPSSAGDGWSRLHEQFVGQAIDVAATIDGGGSALAAAFSPQVCWHDGDARNTRLRARLQATADSKAAIVATASGQLRFSVSCMRQSRAFILHETLRALQYGRLMSRIGFETRAANFSFTIQSADCSLNSNLYWRITKALLQFQAVKRRLMRVATLPVV